MEPTDNYDQTHQPRGTKRKGSWIRAEDDLLRKCIEKYGEGNWNQVPVRAGLHRCRKSCRLRWLNYLKPNIKQGEFAMDEVDLIIRMHKLLGNKWSLIAGRLPGRTGNGVKNYWNTHLKPSKQRPESNVTTKQSKQHPESNVTHLKQSKQRCPESNVTRKQSKQRPESNVMHLKQSKQRCPESNVTMNIHKAEDKQIIRNDHQDKVLVIRPKPQSFSENSKWIKKRSILIMRGSTDIEQPASSSSPRMVTKSTDSHEPLPELLTDEALTSWWQENINVLLDHGEHQMKKRTGGVLLAERVINSACCCRCSCNKSTTDDQSTTPTDKEQQDLCVDDYLLNELQNIPW